MENVFSHSFIDSLIKVMRNLKISVLTCGKNNRAGINLDHIKTLAGYGQLRNELRHFINKTPSYIDLTCSSNITSNCGIEKTIH